MKTNFFSFLIAFFAISTFLTAQKTSISGVSIPKTFALKDNTLLLNGSAIRDKYFIDIYVGSLYLPAKSNNAKQIITADSDMGFRLKIVSGLLTSDKMKKGIGESFDKVAKQYPVSPQVYSKFLTFFNEKIVKGDEFFIGYTNSDGLLVHKNGKLIGVIKDLPLKKALFATWLANAISKEFTSSVLNGN
jgi:hypothetical protein